MLVYQDAAELGEPVRAGARRLTGSPTGQIGGPVLRRMLCVVRGGHRWETTTDTGGSITLCTRCGKLDHTRGSADASVHAVHDERP